MNTSPRPNQASFPLTRSPRLQCFSLVLFLPMHFFVFLARCPCALPLCNALVRCSCAVVHLCDAPIQCVQLLFFSSLPLSSVNTLPSAISLCNLFLWFPSGALAQWAFAVAFCDSLNCTCAMLLCIALVRCSVILCNAYITVVRLCNNYIVLTAAKLHHTNLIA